MYSRLTVSKTVKILNSAPLCMLLLRANIWNGIYRVCTTIILCLLAEFLLNYSWFLLHLLGQKPHDFLQLSLTQGLGHWASDPAQWSDTSWQTVTNEENFHTPCSLWYINSLLKLLLSFLPCITRDAIYRTQNIWHDCGFQTEMRRPRKLSQR